MAGQADFGVTMKLVKASIRQQSVLRPAERANLRFLYRTGGYLRRGARFAIRRRKRISRTGEPPSAHSKDKTASIKNIAFAVNRAAMSVDVGPVKLNQKQSLNNVLLSGTVPGLLERGGIAGIREKEVAGRWRPVGRRRPRPGQATRVRRARYRKRPYMQPTLEKAVESGRVPNIWSAEFAGAA